MNDNPPRGLQSDLMLLLLVGDSVNPCNLLDKVVLVERRVQPAGLDGLDRRNGLNSSSGSEAVPDERLGSIHLQVTGVAEGALDSLDLGNVADQCAALPWKLKVKATDKERGKF